MTVSETEFAALFEEQHPPLLRFLECLLGRPEIAQEIAQETFLRFYEHAALSSPAEARFWLFRVARNLALNEIGRSRTRRQLRDEAASALHPRPRLLPDDEARLGEQIRTILTHLAGLPESQRSALLLREQEGMSYAEIASVLGISLSKVKVDIHRARQQLRSVFRSSESREARA